MTADAQLRAQVKAALALTGISQAQAARSMGLSNKHLNQMINGRAVLTLAWAERILALCGMQIIVSIHLAHLETTP